MAKPRKKMRREKPEFEQKLLDLRRVTRVVKGGRRFRFRATVVIGDRRGKVGVGVSKGSDVSDAIAKAYAGAKKDIITVPLIDGTIPHDIEAKVGSARVLLKPAKEGRGLIAGGAVRTIADLSGIRDITSKSLGTSNKLNVARATLYALSLLKPTKKRSEKKEIKEKEEQKPVEAKEKEKEAKEIPEVKKPIAKKAPVKKPQEKKTTDTKKKVQKKVDKKEKASL